MDNYKILSAIDNIIDSYNEPVERISGLIRNPKEIIRRVEFYTNSEYLSGNKDSLGRQKPFYNVSNYRVTTAKTNTDLDVKDIRYEPDSLKDAIPAMLINHELYKNLKDTNFSLTLNEMGMTRPKYGGLLVKKTKKDGKLNIEVVDWVNVDFDPGDVLGGAIIETFYMQPSELAERSDVWDNVDAVLKEHNRVNKNKPAKIEVKQISGDFPESLYPDNENNNDYVDNGKYARMCMYVAYIGKKKYLLYYEYEKNVEYKYLPWETIGKGLGRGVVEDGFESQWAINDAMISMKNAMELSGKVVLATDSQKVSGNAITGVDNGHIFELEPGRSITSLNLSASSLPQFQNIIELWNQQYDRVASTFDANTGEAPTAGTPYSQTALLNQVANTPFEYRREEWGIFLNEILNDWILPEIKKNIKKAHYLTSEFSDEELDLIDESIANLETNKMIIDTVLNGGMIEEGVPEQYNSQVRQELAKRGKKREIDIPEGFLDVEGRLTANITGELKNKAALLQSLDSIFKTVVSTFNPNTGTYGALQDPALSKIFGQIIEMSGVPFSSAQFRPTQQADVSAIQPTQPI
jgi:hypothetical protein